MKKYPGGRRHQRQPARRGDRQPCPGEAPGGQAGERLQTDARPGENSDRNRAENLLPPVPIWELGEVIATHQPDETGARKAPAQRLQRVGGIGRAEFRLNACDDDAPVLGRDLAGLRQALGKGGHPDGRLQRILRRDQPPDLVKAEPLQGEAADMEMAAMGRVERSAEQADPPMMVKPTPQPSPACEGGRPPRLFPGPPPRAEKGVRRASGGRVGASSLTLPQGRTWPLPRTRYL